MRVIKRNGSEAEFDAEKIRTAIRKATASVKEDIAEAVLTDMADNVSIQCRLLGRAVGVEEIQNFVEEQLMMFGKYDVV